MNILLLAYSFPPAVGGAEKLLGDLAEACDPEGLSVLAGSRNGHAEKDYDARSKYPIARVRFEPPSFADRVLLKIGSLRNNPVQAFYHYCYCRSIAEARRLVGIFQPKIIVCGWSFLLETAIVLKSSDKKIVAIAYGRDVLEAEGNQYLCDLWKGADRVLAISRFTSERLTGIGVDSQRIRLAFPGIDPAISTLPGKAPDLKTLKLDGKKIILTICRLVPHKGTDTLIEAMPMIRRDVPNAALVVVGDGPYRADLERKAVQSGQSGNILFVGWVSEEEKFGWYSACDVFAMPSRWDRTSKGIEGYGYAFLEAGAFGKPVVGGNSGGIPDTVEDGVTGVLVDPNDAGAVAGAITSLLKNPEKARKMGEAGRKRVETERNANTRVKIMLDEILSV